MGETYEFSSSRHEEGESLHDLLTSDPFSRRMNGERLVTEPKGNQKYKPYF